MNTRTVLMDNFVRVGYTAQELHLRITEDDNTVTATVSYKGCHNSKSFRQSETAHSDAERWVNDLALPIIHGATDMLPGHERN